VAKLSIIRGKRQASGWNQEDTMADETPTPTITDELSKMGKLVAQAIQAAWESEERKKLETEVVDGLRKFGDEVAAATKKAGESDTAKQIKTQAEKVAADMQQKDVAGDIRKGLISGLEVINVELGKLVERLEPKKAPAEPVAEPVAEPATAPVAEPAAEGATEAPAAEGVAEVPAAEPATEPEPPAAA
jgi:phage-related protein